MIFVTGRDKTGPTHRLRDTESSLVPYKTRLRDFVATNFFDGDATKALEFLTHIDRASAAPSDFFFAGFTCGVCLCFLLSIWHVLQEDERKHTRRI